VWQRDVRDRRIEELHEGSEGDGDRDKPWVDAYPLVRYREKSRGCDGLAHVLLKKIGCLRDRSVAFMVYLLWKKDQTVSEDGRASPRGERARPSYGGFLNMPFPTEKI
jgi:hypothetical protein